MMNQNQPSKLPVPDRWAYLWLAIAAILLLFTYGMYRNPLGAWLAPVFLIRFLRGQKIGRGFLLTFLVLAVTNTITWWNTTYENPAVVRIIFGVIVGLMYSIGFLLDRVFVRRYQGFAATLIFPLAYTSFEFLTTWSSPMSSYNSLAYSVAGNTYLTQLVSITGLWGVTFIVCWFASTVNWIWEEGVAWQRIRRGAAIYAAVMFAVFLYGMIRLTYFLPEPGSVRIHGIIETDYDRQAWNNDIWPLSRSDPQAFRAEMAPIYDRYLQATIREAQAGAQLVVWPEAAIEGFKEEVDEVILQAREIARQEEIYLVFGINLIDAESGTEGENRLLMIDPRGEIVVDQLKYGCTLAFGMYDARIQTVDTPYGRLGGVICCDADFPYVIRQASAKGIDILLVPSFEPSRENLFVHSQMAVFRSIENGVSIFRPTVRGISLAIDPFGRTIASMNDTLTDERVVVVQVPNHRVSTIYALTGDLFGWLTVAGFLFVIAFQSVTEKRARRSAALISKEYK